MARWFFSFSGCYRKGSKRKMHSLPLKRFPGCFTQGSSPAQCWLVGAPSHGHCCYKGVAHIVCWLDFLTEEECRLPEKRYSEYLRAKLSELCIIQPVGPGPPFYFSICKFSLRSIYFGQEFCKSEFTNVLKYF